MDVIGSRANVGKIATFCRSRKEGGAQEKGGGLSKEHTHHLQGPPDTQSRSSVCSKMSNDRPEIHPVGQN